jgi:hypothetical protein
MNGASVYIIIINIIHKIKISWIYSFVYIYIYIYIYMVIAMIVSYMNLHTVVNVGSGVLNVFVKMYIYIGSSSQI